MNVVEARARLSMLTDSTQEPTLSVSDLDDLLRRAKVSDINGLHPEDTGWVETYNVNHAASMGWKVKQGRLSNAYLFMSGGKMLSRNQMFDHCERMSRRYAMSSGVGSVPMRTARGRRPLRDEGVAPPGIYIDGFSAFSGSNGTLTGVVTNWSGGGRSPRYTRYWTPDGWGARDAY